jgi:hypothetical protein
MKKKAIQNQEWSPDDAPYVNIFYCMGLMAHWVVQLAVDMLYLVVRWSVHSVGRGD